jgi:toxin YoeB
MKKIWFDEAWKDYEYWQKQDKKTMKRINMLLKDIERGSFDGIGKPDFRLLQQQRYGNNGCFA